MFADYSVEIKIAIFQPFRNANVTYEDRPKIAVPSLACKALSYGEKIAKIGPVRPEIFDIIR